MGYQIKAQKFNHNIRLMFLNQPDYQTKQVGFDRARNLNELLENTDLSVVDISKLQIDSADGIHYEPKHHIYIVEKIFSKVVS